MSNLLDEQYIKEKEFQQIIFDDKEIQKGIVESIFDTSGIFLEFDKETEFINGITSDFTLIDRSKNEIFSILECKRPDIGVTEYVRGIGQLLQYEYFFEKKISPKKFSEFNYISKSKSMRFKNALVIPSYFIKNTNLNIGKFKYPETSIIIEVNLSNKNVRKLTNKDLQDLSTKDSNTIAISQYYFRDNRVFEYYILLKFLNYWHSTHPEEKLPRTLVENKYLKKIKTINNGNWRNAFITVSNIGFIDSENKLTISGNRMANLSLNEFTFILYKDYMKPYVDILLNLFESNSNILKMTNKEIALELKKKYNGKDVLYLTESDGRYISSWLNIMRDDLSCIDFKPRNTNREVTKYINKYRDDEIQRNIEVSLGETYYRKYIELVRDNFK